MEEPEGQVKLIPAPSLSSRLREGMMIVVEALAQGEPADEEVIVTLIVCFEATRAE